MNSTSLTFDRGWAYLQLMRPANILTAWADILAGFAVSGALLTTTPALAWLLLSTTGLYGGGVVFNDVFDAELDAVERPERPIPSDRASRQGATILGSVLLVVGIIAAAQVSWLSAGLAAFIACAALCYDAIAKHHSLVGPLNMGLCRGGNVLLGVSAVPAMVSDRWYLAIIPILYIGAITAISQGEVHGGKRATGVIALVLISVVIGSVLVIASMLNTQPLTVLPFLILLGGLVIPPFINATREPVADHIRAAVKAGVVALIVLDAAIASGFSGFIYGLLILVLLPFSIGLARLFSVT